MVKTTDSLSRSHSRPMARPAPAADAQPAVRAAATTGPILLIDDDSAVRESLRRVLESEGWRVTAARDGVEALEFLRRQEPALVITDLCMATVTGWDLLFHESLERPHLPIFVITALSPETAAGAELFATAFFEKPLDLDKLIAAIRPHVCPAEPRRPRA